MEEVCGSLRFLSAKEGVVKKLLSAAACCGLMLMGFTQDDASTQEQKTAGGPANAMPDLVLNEWYNSRGYDLEDYRGQLNFLVFYADNGG